MSILRGPFRGLRLRAFVFTVLIVGFAVFFVVRCSARRAYYGSALSPEQARSRLATARIPVNDETLLFLLRREQASSALYDGVTDDEAVALLLKAGANPDCSTADGTPALVLATLRRNQDAVGMLLQAGADPDKQNQPQHETALITASRLLNVAVVKQLLNAGADPNLRGGSGTALTVVIPTPQKFQKVGPVKSRADIVKLLLKHGADPKQADVQGQTALEKASKCGCPLNEILNS